MTRLPAAPGPCIAGIAGDAASNAPTGSAILPSTHCLLEVNPQRHAPEVGSTPAKEYLVHHAAEPRHQVVCGRQERSPPDTQAPALVHWQGNIGDRTSDRKLSGGRMHHHQLWETLPRRYHPVHGLNPEPMHSRPEKCARLTAQNAVAADRE
eukprot:12410262-Karenia_brevis.AAC.1